MPAVAAAILLRATGSVSTEFEVEAQLRCEASNRDVVHGRWERMNRKKGRSKAQLTILVCHYESLVCCSGRCSAS